MSQQSKIQYLDFLTKINTTTDMLCLQLRQRYPAISYLNGFASLEIKKTIMIAFIMGALETSQLNDIQTNINELIYKINKTEYHG